MLHSYLFNFCSGLPVILSHAAYLEGKVFHWFIWMSIPWMWSVFLTPSHRSIQDPATATPTWRIHGATAPLPNTTTLASPRMTTSYSTSGGDSQGLLEIQRMTIADIMREASTIHGMWRWLIHSMNPWHQQRDQQAEKSGLMDAAITKLPLNGSSVREASMSLDHLELGQHVPASLPVRIQFSMFTFSPSPCSVSKYILKRFVLTMWESVTVCVFVLVCVLPFRSF